MATNPQNMSACFSHPSHPPWCPHPEKGQQALTLQDPSLQGTWSDMSQETLDSFAVFSESIEQCKLARTCFIYYIINKIKHIHKPKIKQRNISFSTFPFPAWPGLRVTKWCWEDHTFPSILPSWRFVRSTSGLPCVNHCENDCFYIFWKTPEKKPQQAGQLP